MPNDQKQKLMSDGERLESLPNRIRAFQKHITTKLRAAEEHLKRLPHDLQLLSVKQLALVLGWSEHSVRERDKQGLLPQPLRFKGTIQWSRQEIGNWIKAGCPDRQTWEEMKAGKGL